MNKPNQIQIKSYEFAVKIVELYKTLVYEKHEYVLGRQILRSGTSIGANVEEAIGAHSEKDFIAKLTIAYKESRETHYWLRILKDTHIISQNIGENLIKICEELMKIITSILKTMKKKIEKSVYTHNS